MIDEVEMKKKIQKGEKEGGYMQIGEILDFFFFQSKQINVQINNRLRACTIPTPKLQSNTIGTSSSFRSHEEEKSSLKNSAYFLCSLPPNYVFFE